MSSTPLSLLIRSLSVPRSLSSLTSLSAYSEGDALPAAGFGLTVDCMPIFANSADTRSIALFGP